MGAGHAPVYDVWAYIFAGQRPFSPSCTNVPNLLTMAVTSGDGKHAYGREETRLEMIDLDPRVTSDVAAQPDKASVEVLDSAFAHLSLWQCLKTFKWTTIFTVLVLTGGVFDGTFRSHALTLDLLHAHHSDIFPGYCLTVPGLIAANRSYIDTFGTIIDEDGITQLNATYVSVWGGIQSAGQIVALITGGWTSDYLGRKFNLWYMSVLMVVVSPSIADALVEQG